MKKNITKILITLILATSLSSSALAQSELFVSTGNATNITQTSANLHGTGGWDADYPPGCTSSTLYSGTTGLPCNSGGSASSPTLPITGYFRYSTLPISPVYCNDIYGSRMLSTKDYPLNTLSATVNRQNFAQSIFNLRPNTTYYYCAIISNRDNIAYGGTNAVKEFHTNCLETTVETKSATNVRSTSVRLQGSFCSTKTVKTYFEYRQVLDTPQAAQPWTKVGEVNRVIGTNSNLYGNFNFNLSGLKPGTEYQFKAVAETSTENPEGLPPENFTTTPIGPTIPPLPPVCWSPQVLNPATNTCFTPPPPTCVPPQFYDSQSRTCMNPVSCQLPEVYYPPTNICVTPPTCESPQVLNPSSNTCITPPTPDFCTTNPTDPECLPGPGWDWTGTTWTGGGWNGGTWTGGSWSNGTWSGGTWRGNTGCVWSGGVWSNGSWSGGRCVDGSGTGGYRIINSTALVLGQHATPPWDAIVRYHEGIETVFTRQIMADVEFARLHGYQSGMDLFTFAGELAHTFAKMFGYVDASGREIRVSFADRAAYQLQLVGNKLTVYEYFDERIVDLRNATATFKTASGYEYNYKK